MCSLWKNIFGGFVLLSLVWGTSMAAVRRFRMVSTDNHKDYNEKLLLSQNGTSQAQCAYLCSGDSLCKTFQTCKPLDLCPATCKTFSSLHRDYVEPGAIIPGTTINNYDSISDQMPAGDHVFCRATVCYSFVTHDPDPWTVAIKQCNDKGGDIATVDDDGELNFLNKTINENFPSNTFFWINGIYINGVWKSFDLTPLSYVKWQESSPDFLAAGMACIVLTDFFYNATLGGHVDTGFFLMDDDLCGQWLFFAASAETILAAHVKAVIIYVVIPTKATFFFLTRILWHILNGLFSFSLPESDLSIFVYHILGEMLTGMSDK